MSPGITYITPIFFGPKTAVPSKKQSTPALFVSTNPHAFSNFDSALSIQNKAFINFKRYDGDQHPLKKLFGKCTNRGEIYEDQWTKDHIYQVGDKKWVNAYPNDLLKRSVEQTVQSICTLTKPTEGIPRIPNYIPTPQIGPNRDEANKWGRHANYIEINPRVIAKYSHGSVSEGILGVLKLLPAIPPSPANFANCIILSQLYPSFNDDGNIANDGLYRVKIPDNIDRHHNEKISKNLVVPGLAGKMGEEEQVAAFNQAAHLLGLKTGIRMPLSAGQLMVKDSPFNWYDNEKDYINACKWAIELGFDAIYFDSAKHITKSDGYCGQGDLPNFEQMKYMLHVIRQDTNREDIAFIGEKSNKDYEYKEMGLSAGTDWGKADDIDSVKYESRDQAYNRDYAAGPEVSNDNYGPGMSYEQRLHRIKSCLYGYDNIHDKLPTYMQLNDLFPLNTNTNTHELMEHTHQTSGSNAMTEEERHWDGCFSTEGHARDYTQNVYHEFEHVMHR